MKKLHLVIAAASMIVTGVAQAQTFDFTFTSSGLDATGEFTLVNGIATSGSINVTNVPVEASPSTLLTASGDLLPGSGNARDYNGDVATYDNQVTLANTPVLDGNGLAFASGQYSTDHYSTLIGLNGGDIYGNIPPTTYTLFVGVGTPTNVEYVYDYSQSGTLTVTAAPEPSSWALGLIGVVSVWYLRRRARCA